MSMVKRHLKIASLSEDDLNVPFHRGAQVWNVLFAHEA